MEAHGDREQSRYLFLFKADKWLYSEDKNDHAGLAKLLAESTGWPVAVPNYRLTKAETPLLHPGHSEDTLAFMEHVRDLRGPFDDNEQPFDRDRIYLMGHSCSAHTLASIVLDSPHPSLKPSSGLLRSIRAVVFSEGIYDIDKLLESFPSYRDWFITAAFGDRKSFADDAVSKYSYRSDGAHIRWFIVHSKGDTLVDVVQSQTMFDYLLSIEGGKSEPKKLLGDFHRLDMEHNDILGTKQFVDMVVEFFRG